jgi:hypothetical protein
MVADEHSTSGFDRLQLLALDGLGLVPAAADRSEAAKAKRLVPGVHVLVLLRHGPILTACESCSANLILKWPLRP